MNRLSTYTIRMDKPKNAKVNRECLQEVFMSELDLAAMNFCLACSNNVAKGVLHRPSAVTSSYYIIMLLLTSSSALAINAFHYLSFSISSNCVNL